MQHVTNPEAAGSAPAKLPATRIGIIGLGRMGQVFSELLLGSVAHLMVYDRDSERVEALARRGATPASGVRDFAHCEVVLTSLPDDDVVRAVVLSESGLASVLRPGSIHLSTSTIGVAFCRELDAAHRKLDQTLVAMPVLGNPDMAARRELFILLGGPTDAIERCRPVRERLGQRSFHGGEQPWLASAMKLACNMLAAATLQRRGLSGNEGDHPRRVVTELSRF
jgi:3-hydroxyisobutyrate dehydrogenase-like beta-hydroxyacid dehydrogenase